MTLTGRLVEGPRVFMQRRHASSRSSAAPGHWPVAADLVSVTVLGGCSGAFGAFCYYADTLRPLAHSVGLWICAALVASAGRRHRGHPVLGAVVTLVAAVVCYYVVRDMVLRSYGLDVFNLVLWASGAVVGGIALGLVGALLDQPNWWGAAATAAAGGLLIGDAFVRLHNYGPDIVVVVDAAGTVAVLAWAYRTRRVLSDALLLLVPMTALGYVLVALPNGIEQWIIER